MPTLQELQTAFTNAGTAKDNAFNIATTAHSSLNNCVKGKGDTSNCPTGQPLGTSGMPSFGSSGNPGSCKICNSAKDCKSDCCKEETCVARMNDYNTKISTYNSAVTTYNIAKATLEAHPDYNAQVAAETEAGITTRTIIIIVSIIVVAIIGFFLWKKYGK